MEALLDIYFFHQMLFFLQPCSRKFDSFNLELPNGFNTPLRLANGQKGR
jgi:hypothetical protein